MDKGKLTAVAIVIATIMVLAVAFLYTGERTKRVNLERQLEDLNTKLTTSDAALKSAKQEVERLTQKLQLTEAELRKTSEDLNSLSSVKQEVMAQLDQTRTELEKQVYQKLDVEQRLNKTKDEVKKMQDEVNKLDAMRLDLEAKIRDMEESGLVAKSGNNIELGQIVVSGQNRVKPTEAMSATVLVVNKEYSFAVINLGSKDGLALNDTLGVYDQDKYIGDVTVEKLQEAMAAVNFVSSRLKDKLALEKDYTFKVK
jgi:chromosome segregation ATPase